MSAPALCSERGASAGPGNAYRGRTNYFWLQGPRGKRVLEPRPAEIRRGRFAWPVRWARAGGSAGNPDQAGVITLTRADAISQP